MLNEKGNGRRKERNWVVVWALSVIFSFLGGYYSDRALSSEMRARQAERLEGMEKRLTRIEEKVDQLVMNERRPSR